MLAVAIFLPLLVASPALSKKTLEFAVVDNGAPVKILGGEAYLSDTDVGNYDYYRNFCFLLKNTDQTRTVRAVRMKERDSNVFGEALGVITYGTYDEQLIEPGKETRFSSQYNPTFRWTECEKSINIHPTITKIEVSIDTVLFTDGTQWREEISRPSPPALISHPATCAVKLSDGSRIEIPWDNKGCAAARGAWVKKHSPIAPTPLPSATLSSPPSKVIPTFNGPFWYADGGMIDGHPVVCSAMHPDGRLFYARWNDDACTPARAAWAKASPAPSSSP